MANKRGGPGFRNPALEELQRRTATGTKKKKKKNNSLYQDAMDAYNALKNRRPRR